MPMLRCETVRRLRWGLLLTGVLALSTGILHAEDGTGAAVVAGVSELHPDTIPGLVAEAPASEADPALTAGKGVEPTPGAVESESGDPHAVSDPEAIAESSGEAAETASVPAGEAAPEADSAQNAAAEPVDAEGAAAGTPSAEHAEVAEDTERMPVAAGEAESAEEPEQPGGPALMEPAEAEDVPTRKVAGKTVPADIDPADLAFLPKKPTAWVEERVEALRSGFHDRAMEAVQELPEAGRQAAEAVTPYLDDDDEDIRIRSILVVRDAGDVVAGRVLAPLLRDASPKIRYHASVGLRTLYDENLGFHQNAPDDVREELATAWAERAEAVAQEQLAREAAVKERLGLKPDAKALPGDASADAAAGESGQEGGCFLRRIFRR